MLVAIPSSQPSTVAVSTIQMREARVEPTTQSIFTLRAFTEISRMRTTRSPTTAVADE